MGAAEGALVVMAGGWTEAVDRCRERFAWASRVVHAGPVGAGTRMKLAKNLITYASFAAVGEAQRLAEAAGLDLIELGNVVRQSDKVTGGPGAVMFRDTAAPAPADDPWHEILVAHARSRREGPRSSRSSSDVSSASSFRWRNSRWSGSPTRWGCRMTDDRRELGKEMMQRVYGWDVG